MERKDRYEEIRWNRLKQRLENMYLSRMGGWCGQDCETVAYVSGEDHMLKMVLTLMDQMDGTLDDELE